MKLFKQSLLLGLAFEFLLFLDLIVADLVGHPKDPSDPDNWFDVIFTAAHCPAFWLTGHLISYPVNLAISVIMAVTGWTGLSFVILYLFKKLFRKKHDHDA